MIQTAYAHALIINEIMSNPTGDDGGREWIEVYNDTSTEVNLASLTISIKGGSFIPVTPVSGGTTISANGYAIIGSTVSGATKFAIDYPAYTGPLFKSAITLVNSGITSIELKMDGTTLDSLPSYTAAKEGSTYSRIGTSFVIAIPTPGKENDTGTVDEGGGDATTTPPTGTQGTIPQMSPPSSDIVIYLPQEKTVVAGAPSTFSAYSLTREGKTIDKLSYKWSFGEGGEGVGSTTLYRYLYPGRYMVQVEAGNTSVVGVGKMIVRVVSPELQVSSVATGKYGKYIDITNPNKYDLDISGWKLVINDVPFSFPHNTVLLQGSTRLPLATMGLASTTLASSTIIKILFPTSEEVLRVYQAESLPPPLLPIHQSTSSLPLKKVKLTKYDSLKKEASVVVYATSSNKGIDLTTKKDTRIASFMRSIFGR